MEIFKDEIQVVPCLDKTKQNPKTIVSDRKNYWVIKYINGCSLFY